MVEKTSSGGLQSAAVADVLKTVGSGTVVALVTVFGLISFATIVYSGPLAPFVGTGIGLLLLGAAVMSAIGGFLYSFRGTVCFPQDITTIVIAVAVANLGASWPAGNEQGLLATAVMLIATATAAAGIVAYVFGHYRMGFLARFIPYPVVGGFVAATGYLLVVGGIGVCLGQAFDAGHPSILFEADRLHLWLPWFALGTTTAILSRWIRADVLLPVAFVLGAAGFYLALRWAGIDLETASGMGLLIGPFEQASFLESVDPGLIFAADWSYILGQSITLAALALLTVTGTLLHATGLEFGLDRESDLEKDLQGTGIANMAAAPFGGLIGFQSMSGTTLGRRLHLGGVLPGLSVAAGCMILFFWGGALLSVLPLGLFVAFKMHIGVDFLLTWVWHRRNQMSRADHLLILLILFVTAVFGITTALAVGVAAAAAFFILSFAQVEVVRLRSTLASRRSLVERRDEDVRYLMQAGTQTSILELSGYLFFGTANTLFERLRSELNLPGRPRTLIVDFTRVKGIDASVSHTLGKLSKLCTGFGVRLVFSGMSRDLGAAYLQQSAELNTAVLVPTLGEALQAEEAALLAERAGAAGAPDAGSLLDHDLLEGLAAVLEPVRLAKGEILLRQGAASSEMFVLLEGTMHAEVAGPGGTPVVVARFVPGAPIGEIAFYSDVPRTATVIADEPCLLLRVDAESLGPDGLGEEAASRVHRFVATSLARRLRNATLLLRDADI